jgi:hypothetical protein
MSTPSARLLATLTGLALAAAALWRAGSACPVGTASPPAPPAPSAEATIYDPDSQHLWNRLHRALWVRTGPDGKEYGLDRLDPLLWMETKYLLEGKPQEQAIAVLDEFLAKDGEKLVQDPLKRAILQRDLWAMFDWTAEPRAYRGRTPPPRRALQLRLARIIQRLALTPKQIEALPDSYAAAVASRAFAQKYDPDRPERPFLPADLFQKDGPWVEVQDSDIIASVHAFDFGYRSAFRVFLRFPEGREATVAYLARLRDFPRPWVLTPPGPDRKKKVLKLNPELPQLPAGTQAALVRQMLLIDNEGRIAATPATESVQLRVFRAIHQRASPEDRRDAPSDQAFFEFIRSRALLFAGKTVGLRPLGAGDKDFQTQFQVHPFDVFEAKDSVPTERDPTAFERTMTPTVQECLGCHDRPGIFSFRSYTGGLYPRGQYYLPDLQPGDSAVSEGKLSALNKRQQYSWGLLQGLWEDQPRR